MPTLRFQLGDMISTYFQIVPSTASRSDEAPEFPKMSNIIEDLISPVLQVIFVGFVSLTEESATKAGSARRDSPSVSPER